MESDFSATLTDGRRGFNALIDALESHLAQAGVPPGVAAPVMIAADEVISNCADYGDAARIDVRVRVSDARVTMEVSDDGRPFNPLEAPPPDTSLGVDERQIGGLGIHLVKTLMDTVSYERRSGRNHLRFSKAYPAATAS